MARFDQARLDAGDLVQEVFTRAFHEKARRSFDDSREYGPYLGALSRNLLIDLARKGGREILSEHLEEVPDTVQSEPEEWANRETMAAVNRYIDGLPPELRDVHEHRYVQCRSQEETCGALGISRQQLRTREKHLCDGLRRYLKRLELTRPDAPRQRSTKVTPAS
jgi:RNA polymerase sigma factor (sigma-70 family)